MLRSMRTLAMIAALSPSLVPAADSTTTVRVMKPRSPYQRGAAAARWVLPPPPAPIAPRLPRVAAAQGAAADRGEEAAHQRRILALARARACKVFDRNASGTPDGGEPLVEGWRIRLGGGRGGAQVRATDWDGCARFTGLRPGRYTLREIFPPLWDPGASEEVSIDVRVPTGLVGADAPPTYFTSGCVHYARLGSAEYWRGPSGVRLLDEGDQRHLNALGPFRSPSAAFAAGDEPFDGRFADGVTPVRGAFVGSRAWGRGSWQAEVALFLGDRRVSADPRGRLAQEILVFALNSRHFLERAQIVFLDDLPIFVDDLLFEGVLAWHGDSPGWNHDMTALLAALNSMNGLRYVPRDQCQVAYVPF